MTTLKVDQMVVSQENRKIMDPDKMKELISSIHEKGIITPLLVRMIGSKNDKKSNYEIVAGERRYRAAIHLKMDEIPCTIRNMDDQEAAQVRIIENLQREDVNAIEEAEGFELMAKLHGFKVDSLASKIGKSESYVIGRLKLLVLNAEIKNAIAINMISPGHGLVLARIPDLKEQSSVFKVILQRKLSVHATENILSDVGYHLRNAQFNTYLCESCEHNGTKQKDLFDKSTNIKGRCLNSKCFIDKSSVAMDKKRDELIKKGFQVETEEKLKQKRKGYESYNTHEISSRDNPKRYAAECTKCPDHIFVIEWFGHGDDRIKIIRERCLKSSCYYNEKKDNEPGDKSIHLAKAKKSNRIRAAKRAFWINALNKTSDPLVILSVAADIILSDIRGEDLAKEFGMKGVLYAHAWSIPKLHKLGTKRLHELYDAAMCEKISTLWDDSDLKYLSESIGAISDKQWVITKEYLNATSKIELVKINKELGLGLELQEGMKKSDMVSKILATNTKKIPHEMSGKK